METPSSRWAKGTLRRTILAGIAFATALMAAGPALAESHDGVWSRSNLLGNMGGLRTELGRYGISLSVGDTENLLGNVTGGVKRSATMQGVTTLGLDIDTARAVGVSGGTFHASALQIHGQPLSGPYLDNLQAANGTEAENGTRLWELWYDQAFDGGWIDVKLGQQSIDNEFMVSARSALFVNTMAGWPLVPSVDLYGGGPAYPLSSLGVRLQAKPTGTTMILAGVFDDNPGGGAFDVDAQALDAGGTKFNLNTGALVIAELQYAARISGLSGTYKIGGWYDTGFFPDQLTGTDGLPLAAADSNGNPVMHHGNYSLYAVVDQTVWQSAVDHTRTLNVFGRIIGAATNRNLVDFFFNGGVTFTAPLPGRRNDTAGIDFGIGDVSSRAADYDRDAALPPRTREELFELTYRAQLTGWLQLQPDLQYVINPGAGVPDPVDRVHRLRDELIVGARSNVTF